MADNVIDLDSRCVRPRPTPRRRSQIDQRKAALAANEAHDVVVQAAANPEVLDVLQVSLVELSKEAAALLFDRLHLPPHSREVGRLASRRIRALKAVAAARLEIARIQGANPSPNMIRRVVELLSADVLAASRDVLDHSAADRLAVAFQRLLDQRLNAIIGVAGTAAPNAQTGPTVQPGST